MNKSKNINRQTDASMFHIKKILQLIFIEKIFQSTGDISMLVSKLFFFSSTFLYYFHPETSFTVRPLNKAHIWDQLN